MKAVKNSRIGTATFIVVVAFAMAGCCCPNKTTKPSDKAGPRSVAGVTNIVVSQPADRTFSVGDNVTVEFSARGCDGKVTWSFNGLPNGWTASATEFSSASVTGEAPVGSAVQGIAFEAVVFCDGSNLFTNIVHLLPKAFVKEFPALNHPIKTGTVWADYSVDLGRAFVSTTSYAQEWAEVGVDTGGLIKTDGIQLLSEDGNTAGNQHILDQIDGPTKLSNNPKIPFESGELFNVEPAGFKVFAQHPFNIRLFFVDKSQNDPDRNERLKTHQVGLIRIVVK